MKIMNPEDKPQKLHHVTKLCTMVSSPWEEYDLVTDPFGEQARSHDSDLYQNLPGVCIR